MEELIKIIKQFEKNGYTANNMEGIVRNYTEEYVENFDGFTVDEIICALEEESSCWTQ